MHSRTVRTDVGPGDAAAPSPGWRTNSGPQAASWLAHVRACVCARCGAGAPGTAVRLTHAGTYTEIRRGRYPAAARGPLPARPGKPMSSYYYAVDNVMLAILPRKHARKRTSCARARPWPARGRTTQQGRREKTTRAFKERRDATARTCAGAGWTAKHAA